MRERFLKVCWGCFKADSLSMTKCHTCHGRGVISLIPAKLAETGEEIFLEIVE